MIAAKRAGAAPAPVLEIRLRKVMGSGWRAKVNDWNGNHHNPDGWSLADDRLCLKVFGGHDSTRGWARGDLREIARRLKKFADAAHHVRPLSDDNVREAKELSRRPVLWATRG